MANEIRRSSAIAHGRADGMGRLDPGGSYILLTHLVDGRGTFPHLISEGNAETLIAELQGALAAKAPADPFKTDPWGSMFDRTHPQVTDDVGSGP